MSKILNALKALKFPLTFAGGVALGFELKTEMDALRKAQAEEEAKRNAAQFSERFAKLMIQEGFGKTPYATNATPKATIEAPKATAALLHPDHNLRDQR